MNKKKSQIILGIDPGSRITGYGVIKFEARVLSLIDFGCIRTQANMRLSERYHRIHEGLGHLMEKFQPDSCAIESQFIAKNAQSSLKLGMVKGVALVAASCREIPIFAYAPSRAKQAVVGNGRASKEQVGAMVQRLLSLNQLPSPEDAADALALAICHAFMVQSERHQSYLV